MSSIMTPISLEPPVDLLQNLVLFKVRMEDLRRYIESGVRLPVTTEDYQKQLGLDSAAVNQLHKNITGILGIYGSIRAHCKDFKDNIFPATVGLANCLCNYSKGAERYYELIYTKLVDLFDPRGVKKPNPSAEKMISILADREVADIRKMRRMGNHLLKNLRRFETLTANDESTVNREKISLERGLEGHREYLAKRKEEVDKLEQVANTERSYDETSTVGKWCQIPFVGWVPAAFLSTAYGLTAAHNMLKYLRRVATVEPKAETLANMILQNALAMNDLKKVLKLIRDAIALIESIQGHFGTIYDDLMHVTEIVSDNLCSPSDLGILSCDFSIIKDKWINLAQFAHHYRQVAWISPPDAQQFVNTVQESDY